MKQLKEGGCFILFFLITLYREISNSHILLGGTFLQGFLAFFSSEVSSVVCFCS